MKTKIAMLLAASVPLLAALNACRSSRCDDTITRPDPTDPTKEVHLIRGEDGSCRWPWYDEENWGSPCESNEDCGEMLLCLAPDLPICTQIGCSLEDDDVCAEGFMCISPGRDQPNVCIPMPTTPPAGTGGTSSTGGSSGTGNGGDGGMGGGSPDPDPDPDPEPTVLPNIGTTCSMAGDPVCVGGTGCAAPSLPYCTVQGCVAAGAAKDACDAAAVAGFVCMAGAPFPDAGVCYRP